MPSKFKGWQKPVTNVSWNDAVEFCYRLSALPEERAAGRVYRLPTEAEWEYACRGGTTTKYSFGNDTDILRLFGWFVRNVKQQQPSEVGLLRPNPWGLYDMHGNVHEWCHDWYGEDWYRKYLSDAMTAPNGPNSGSKRVHRGGAADSGPLFCRSANRGGDAPSVRSPSLGFRVVLVPSEQ